MLATEHPLETCVARVWTDPYKAVDGAAFLVGDNLLCTCTHVLQGNRANPAADVWVNFPFLGDKKLRATLVGATAVEGSGGDIAFLSLLDPLPQGAMALRTFESRFSVGMLCDTYGFPLGYEEGIPTSAVIGNRTALGWRNLIAVNSQGVVIERGFSGAPVWDIVRQCIVGMIVAMHRKALVSFVIPSEVISKVCPQPLDLSDAESVFDERVSELLLRSAVRLADPEPIASYLSNLLREHKRGTARKWIYLTLGQLGGLRAKGILRIWTDRETDLAARDGLEDAQRILRDD
ncbi:serine protease [Bosea sp. BIWAKO-01]|uniref:S1 family peptidase n=1 Tax=Bosea sp. BIWAKO-01 TaxID=506668 RepID=UPI0009424B13